MAYGVFRRRPAQPKPPQFIPTVVTASADTSLLARSAPTRTRRPRVFPQPKQPQPWIPTAEPVVEPSASLLFVARRPMFLVEHRWRLPPKPQPWIGTEEPTVPSESMLFDIPGASARARLAHRPRWRPRPVPQVWIGTLQPAGVAMPWEPKRYALQVATRHQRPWIQPPVPIWIFGPEPDTVTATDGILVGVAWFEPVAGTGWFEPVGGSGRHN